MAKTVILSPNQHYSDHHLEIDSILLLSTSTTSPFGSILHFIEGGESSEHFLGGGLFVCLFRGNLCEVIFAEG